MNNGGGLGAVGGNTASAGASTTNRAETKKVSGGPGFEAHLDACRLRFSRHASERLRRRRITFGCEEMERLEQAVDRVAVKGAHSSLVLMDQLALIVNVPSREVVTALSRDGLKDGVFTDIDSTVIVQGKK